MSTIHLEEGQTMLSKIMNCKMENKVKAMRGALAVVICILYAFSSLAQNIDINDSLNDPAKSGEENINANKFIYRTYDEEMKKKLDDSVIEYGEIEELVHNYNPNIMSMWNSYKNGKSSSEVYDEYMESYDRLMAAGDSSESDAAKARMYAQAYSVKMLADNNVNDSVINFWKNEIDEINQYLDTKKKYINYFVSNYNYLVSAENEKEAVRLAEASKIKYQVGLDTEISYLQAQKNSDDAKANLALAESNKNVAEKNVKVACGKSTGTDVSLGDEPVVDLIAVNSINLEEDIKKAIDNNINMKIYKKSFENANTIEIENHYDILINYAKEEITNSVKTLYNTLVNQNISLATKNRSYMLLIDQLIKGKKDLNNGKISESDYASLEYNVKVAKYQVDIQQLNLLSAYEDYKYAVERGVAAAALS